MNDFCMDFYIKDGFIYFYPKLLKQGYEGLLGPPE